MNGFSAIIRAIIELSPPVLLAVFLNVVGFFLKRSPVPGWIIPWTLFFAGGALYPFIAEEGTVVYNSRHPEIFTALVGACIGGLAVGMHQGISGFMSRGDGKHPAQTIPDSAHD